MKIAGVGLLLGAVWWGWRTNPVQDALTSAVAKSDAEVALAAYPQRVY